MNDDDDTINDHYRVSPFFSFLPQIAGIEGDEELTAETTLANWDRTLGINLTGTFLCCKHEIPLLLESGGGSIVNCSSVAGKIGHPHLPAYVASKHGVIGLTKYGDGRF